MKRISIILVSVSLWVGDALADPPPITWEWYNAAETYRNQKIKGKDDLRIAVRYFRLAAEKGNAAAAYKLGEAYEDGIGVSKDPVLALEWYRRSVAQGDMNADVKIGYFYQKGIVVARDPAEAVRWYRQAETKGNIWACHMLAFLLADGEGLAKDVGLAIRYFEKSIPETNDHWAKWKLAQLLMPSTPQRAKTLLHEAAAQGNVQAGKELKQFETITAAGQTRLQRP